MIESSSSIGMPDLTAGAVRDALPGTDKPVVAFVSPHALAVTRAMNRLGVPAFVSPASVGSAMVTMRETGCWHLRAAAAESAAEAGTVDVNDLPSGLLDAAQAKALFARFGVTPARERIVRTSTDAEQAARDFGDRVALNLL
ncbi:hypothetical protein [Burkholderia pyrrocinia]|uniref:hypothetical protein n=1 Tax=Burkholderia pyrrocinia TaxID=60550 RepID=UPI001F24C9A9|nr:hypothetical protein [Burkholderia pyrrocinia]